ncbi:hypothetical protein FRC08_003082 [Ceratobasidium sp. 394]|nr:hypothetical protein FRC08_003082 [Ceratobasidium sp. 394]
MLRDTTASGLQLYRGYLSSSRISTCADEAIGLMLPQQFMLSTGTAAPPTTPRIQHDLWTTSLFPHLCVPCSGVLPCLNFVHLNSILRSRSSLSPGLDTLGR